MPGYLNSFHNMPDVKNTCKSAVISVDFYDFGEIDAKMQVFFLILAIIALSLLNNCIFAGIHENLAVPGKIPALLQEFAGIASLRRKGSPLLQIFLTME